MVNNIASDESYVQQNREATSRDNDNSILYLGYDDVSKSGISDFSQFIEDIERAYVCLDNDQVIMPKTEYLRYPSRPSYDRIITLLGHIGGDFNVSGLKLICSSTYNVNLGLPRASGVLILNDVLTSRPFAIVEASLISAARTAAVTGLAIKKFSYADMTNLALIGCGQLGITHIDMLNSIFGPTRFDLHLFDENNERSAEAAAYARLLGMTCVISKSAKAAVGAAQIIVPATTAEDAYIAAEWLSPRSLYCAVSLLDARLGVYEQADCIVVDDLATCLAEGRPLDILQKQGKLPLERITSFGSLLSKRKNWPTHWSHLVFNPMGTIITDLVVALRIIDRASSAGNYRLLPV